jgi:REP element-mobilizing transposase RayT
MEPRFGEVIGDDLRMNRAGDLIANIWESNIERFPGAELDAFVVMPNHLHAILFIGTDPATTQRQNLTRIIQAFKSVSTIEYGRRVKLNEFPPYERALWQRSFYDRMLRDERDLEAARRYIESNPFRWIERLESAGGPG